jgi:DNA-3-methyladenine glycosylase
MDFDFTRTAHAVARELIGAHLYVDGVGGRIVETEAYDQLDPASHSFAGKTVRNASMFGPPGNAYVYRSYGLHWCLNIVCMPTGHGAAVLVRALEPLIGLEMMRARRGERQPERLLCAGPGRLCQALGVDKSLDGTPIDREPFVLVPNQDSGRTAITSGVRIGISKSVDLQWRFSLAGSPFVSKPVPKG